MRHAIEDSGYISRRCALLVIAGLFTLRVAVSAPFQIEVVDKESRWPVPMVELRTTHMVKFVTDNAGRVAFDLPEFTNQEVWLDVTADGYEMPADGFGKRGVRMISWIAVALIVYGFLFAFAAIALAPAGWWVEAAQAQGVPDYQAAYAAVFGQGQWSIVGSIIAFLVGPLIDGAIFHRILKMTGGRFVWLRATASTAASPERCAPGRASSRTASARATRSSLLGGGGWNSPSWRTSSHPRGVVRLRACGSHRS